jgi:NCS2 family nucleobase:cation symporter-2
MPAAVIGATFVFTSCAIVKSGIETIASRMLDARRSLVVGLALLTGLAVEAFPGVFHAMPHDIEPLVGSPLVLGTFVGFGLNAVFRFGTRRRAEMQIDPQLLDLGAIHSFMEGRGGVWGARRDVIARASFAAQQLVEAIAESCEPRGPIVLSGSFDEFDLAVEARYAGHPLELPERRPSDVQIRESEDGARLLAGFMLRHNADRATTTRRGESSVVRFQFHH